VNSGDRGVPQRPRVGQTEEFPQNDFERAFEIGVSVGIRVVGMREACLEGRGTLREGHLTDLKTIGRRAHRSAPGPRGWLFEALTVEL